MATKQTRPRLRPPLQVRAVVELVRSDGQDLTIVTAITALQTVLLRRLERIEKKIEAFAAGGLDQQTVDRIAARLKAANDQLASDVSSSTPNKE